MASASGVYSESTKAHGTVFLILLPDGATERQFRVPRKAGAQASRGAGPNGNGPVPLPTSDDLTDRQKSTCYAHETLVVRAAVLDHRVIQKRLLVMMLHPAVRGNGLAVQHHVNRTDEDIERTGGFTSPVRDRWKKMFDKVDPFRDVASIEDVEAYQRLSALSEKRLDSVISLLITGSLTSNPLHGGPLVRHLCLELKVDVRDSWRPDADWLGGYKKCQLGHLHALLRGPAHGGTAQKKSKLVADLEKLFGDASSGILDDEALAQMVNEWLPSKLRDERASD